MENWVSDNRVTRMSPAGWEGTCAADGWGAAGGAGALRARLPTGRRSSFSCAFPRAIQALSLSTPASTAPGSTSSDCLYALGSFIPSAQRIARRAEGVSDTMVPTSTKFVRETGAPPFPPAAGSREGVFIPSEGENGFLHPSTGDGGDTASGAAPAEPVGAFGE